MGQNQLMYCIAMYRCIVIFRKQYIDTCKSCIVPSLYSRVLVCMYVCMYVCIYVHKKFRIVDCGFSET